MQEKNELQTHHLIQHTRTHGSELVNKKEKEQAHICASSSTHQSILMVYTFN